MMKKDRTPHYALPLFAAALLLTLVLCLSSCAFTPLTDGWQNGGDNTVNSPSEDDTQTTLPTTEGTTISTTAVQTTAPQTEPSAPTLYFNPLSGLPCDSLAATARPVALCVRSASCGLISSADLVIEGPTEASATRMMLLGAFRGFPLADAPLASVRPHLAALTNDFFGVPVFCGTNDQGRESVDFLFDSLDTAKLTVAPEADALEVMRTLGIQTEVAGRIALPYAMAAVGETALPQGTPTTYVSVPFSDTASTSFTYDAMTRCYTMRTSSTLSDTAGNLPVFANLLVLFHESTHHVTKDGSELVLDTATGGSGYLVTAGQAVQILWQRDAATSKLRITDADGAEITLNRGKTYVAMTTYEHRARLILN